MSEDIRLMLRFGGIPYWDGLEWRCPECNGFVAEVQAGGGEIITECLTCGAFGPLPSSDPAITRTTSGQRPKPRQMSAEHHANERADVDGEGAPVTRTGRP